MSSSRPQIRVVIVGEVDHGKSTLVGRLLHDTGSLPDGKLAELEAVSRRRGVELEWSFVLDALQAERDQAVTIDFTQVWIRLPQRDVVVIDAPGHEDFIRNMLSAASLADAAVLLVDVASGISEQTRRHAYLLGLFGLKRVIVAVNKMDMVGFDQAAFERAKSAIGAHLERLAIEPVAIVPVAARIGASLVERDQRLAWYGGPTIVELLATLPSKDAPVAAPLRFSVQDVYRLEDRRIVAGRVESGTIRTGDSVVFLPAGVSATVRSLESWGAPDMTEASAGLCVGLVLDREVFVERGDLACRTDDQPRMAHLLKARLVWLGSEPLVLDTQLRLRQLTRSLAVRVQSIDHIIDVGTLDTLEGQPVRRNMIADVSLRTSSLVALDEPDRIPATARMVLADAQGVVAAGLMSVDGFGPDRGGPRQRATNIVPVDHQVTAAARADRNGHKGGVFWLTGLPGSGKSTLAMAVEARLFRKGASIYVLDGDNVRTGLCADLGFSAEDRTENIRRIGEVAKLLAEAGFIVVTAFISPFATDRDRVRGRLGPLFHEVYIEADLRTCEARDPKGHYRRARAGEIREMTGVTSPYEPPSRPEMVIDTRHLTIDEGVDALTSYIERFTRLDSR